MSAAIVPLCMNAAIRTPIRMKIYIAEKALLMPEFIASRMTANPERVNSQAEKAAMTKQMRSKACKEVCK